jgi:hypothetical protein
MAVKPLKPSKRTRNQRKEDARRKRQPWQGALQAAPYLRGTPRRN